MTARAAAEGQTQADPRVYCTLRAEEHGLCRAAEQDAKEVASALAAAFEEYPWTTWLVPADQHLQRLTDLFEITIAGIGIPYGEVWIARCPALNGAAVGAVISLRPDRPIPAAVREELEQHEEPLFGDRLTIVQAAEQACAVLRPQTPHITVGTIGVSAGHQGKGLATRLIRQVLDTADVLASPVYLETSTEANVAFYQRLGFQVTDRIQMAAGGPPVWAMVR